MRQPINKAKLHLLEVTNVWETTILPVLAVPQKEKVKSGIILGLWGQSSSCLRYVFQVEELNWIGQTL